ncbi:MAG: Cna B-type domain-containing protein, partial [Lachnospiraceae bacterium]|nr:Cna B-type domain-containing protein [Lachnospiraceae bacterium]
GTGSTPVTGFSEKRLNDELIIRDGESASSRRARWQAIAATLRPYALADLWPTDFQYTANGRVSFTGLYPGLYLVIADDFPVKENDADYRYRYQPTFVTLPGFENGAWDYDVDHSFDNNSVLRVKYTYSREVYSYRVYKRWYDDNTNVRPTEVRVDIYRDGVLYRTVYLNESNNWNYEWEAGSGNWYVVERTTGNNYSVNISEKEGAFTLDNTYSPPPPPPEEPPDILGRRRTPVVDPVETPEVLGSRRLPQTGQLNWPVPVMAMAGMLLFGAGYYRNRSAYFDSDE